VGLGIIGIGGLLQMSSPERTGSSLPLYLIGLGILCFNGMHRDIMQYKKEEVECNLESKVPRFTDLPLIYYPRDPNADPAIRYRDPRELPLFQRTKVFL
jgi:hypothetical protein